VSVVVSEVFSRMLAASQIEDTVIASMKMWFPTYLREQERQMGLPASYLETPDNYSDRNSFDMEAPEKLPKVVVIAPGTVGAPLMKGDSRYSATWRLGIGLAVGAETEKEANTLVKAYGAVVRGMMLQSSGLGAIGAVNIVWTDESYDDLPIPNQVQLLKAASLYFNIDINNVVTRGHGPDTPDLPAADYVYSDVETVETELDKVPVTTNLGG
jgi:hypothetical protein